MKTNLHLDYWSTMTPHPLRAHAKPEFDPVAFENSVPGKNEAELRKIFRQYPNDPMHPEVIRYWAGMGVRKELFDSEEDEGRHEYTVFTPMSMEAGKKYALVYVARGGGDPLNKAETYGFCHLVNLQKFICVCAWNNGEILTEFPRILKEVQKKGYAVDTTRLYAVGYSAGAGAVSRLAVDCPGLLAAVSPNPGSNIFRHGVRRFDKKTLEKCAEHRLPIVFAGGTMDGGDSWPLDSEEAFEIFNYWMENISKVENFKPMTMKESARLQDASGKDVVKRVFGLDFQTTHIDYQEEICWYVGNYYGRDKAPAARFISAQGVPHTMTKFHSIFIWNYLKMFSRDPVTHESIYDPDVLNGMRDTEDKEKIQDEKKKK